MTGPVDPRVYVIEGVKATHELRWASTSQASKGESWACRCGVEFKGKGSIQKGRRHDIEVILEALDSIAVTA